MESLDLLPFTSLNVRESPFISRPIMFSAHEEMAACQRLRYAYYVEQRGWIAPDPKNPGREIDHYDAHAWHLGVFKNSTSDDSEICTIAQIVGYLRVIPWTAPWGFMLGHEFNCLVSPETLSQLPDTRSVELSRLVITPSAYAPTFHQHRYPTSSPHVIELLLKLLYHLSLKEQIEHYYIVVEAAWLKAFTRRFHLPFQQIGRSHTFHDGTKTIAAYTTRTALEQSVSQHDPQKYQWYIQRPE